MDKLPKFTKVKITKCSQNNAAHEGRRGRVLGYSYSQNFKNDGLIGVDFVGKEDTVSCWAKEVELC